MWVADDHQQSADEFPLADKPFLTLNSRRGWSGEYVLTRFYVSRDGVVIRISEPENENNATTTGELLGNCPMCGRKLSEDNE